MNARVMTREEFKAWLYKDILGITKKVGDDLAKNLLKDKGLK